MTAAVRPRRPWYSRMGLSPSAWLGLVLVGAFLLLALLGPTLAPHPVSGEFLYRTLQAPSAEHWLGTDPNGIDTLSQLCHGARMALWISGSVVLICAVVGSFLGVLAGFFRGWFDELIMRTVDILLAFPGILLNIAIVALLAKPGLGVLIFALSINGWVGYARLARAQVLTLRETEYVQAARSVGAGPMRIIVRHIVPNMLSPLLVMMSLGFGGVVVVEASLSFLGLGPQVSYTWGAMLGTGTAWIWATPRLALIPGVAIMLVVLGSNLLGDGLRDRFDPKRDSQH